MKSKYQALLLTLGVNTLLLSLLASHWWHGLVAGVLIAAAVLALCAPARAQAEASVASEAALQDLLQGVVPAWRNNVQLARTQTQEAIDKLTLRFSGIHLRLGGALKLSVDDHKQDVPQVIQHAATQLSGIATVLEQVLATRDALMRKMEALGRHNDEIRQLAQEVERLAGQTGVADLFSDQSSWTELAERSAESGRQILGKSKAMQAQIQTALAAASPLDADTAHMIEDSRSVIDAVITEFRQIASRLSGTVNQLEDENREADQEVCDILVNLQFQDRISQILEQVQRDMSKLEQLLGNAAPVPLKTVWLAELERTYTTQEQRQAHAGQQVSGVSNAPQSQVDFF